MAHPTPLRRAFSQIQNTIVQQKVTNAKNVTTNDTISTNFEKENEQRLPGKQITSIAAVKTDGGVKNQSFHFFKDDADKPVEDTNNCEIAAGEALNSFDDIDFDAPIEICPHVDCAAASYGLDDILPPDERISLLGPHFWNRFLMPPPLSYPFDSDNKENIFEDLYANLDSTNESIGDMSEGELGLADVQLQKLSLRK